MRSFHEMVADLYRTLEELEYQRNLPADKLSEDELAEQGHLRSHYAALIDELDKAEWPLTSTGCIDLPYVPEHFELSISPRSGNAEEQDYAYTLSCEDDPWIYFTNSGFPSRAAALAEYLRGQMSSVIALPDHLIDQVIEGPVLVPPDIELKTVYTTESPGQHTLELLQVHEQSEECRYTWQIRNDRDEVIWSSTEWFLSFTGAYQAARREIERLDLGRQPSNCMP